MICRNTVLVHLHFSQIMSGSHRQLCSDSQWQFMLAFRSEMNPKRQTEQDEF